MKALVRVIVAAGACAMAASSLGGCGENDPKQDASPAEQSSEDTMVLLDVDGTDVLFANVGGSISGDGELRIAATLVERENDVDWSFNVGFTPRKDPLGTYEIGEAADATLLLTDRRNWFKGHSGTIVLTRLDAPGGLIEGRLEVDLVGTTPDTEPSARRIRSGSFRVKNISDVAR